MEKQLFVLGYWLGLVSTVLAFVLRLCYFFGVTLPHVGPPGGNSLSYRTFLDGAVLFFLLAIASWCRTPKP